MFNRFKWTNPSDGRNRLTAQYEPVQPYLFIEFAKTLGAGIAVDVGANIGQYSLFCREAQCLGAVYAFEAEQVAYDQLIANIELNNLSHLIKPHFGIVSSRSGQVEFGVASAMAGNNAVLSTSIHNATVYKENRLLSAITLDDELALNDNVIVLKIDVEGHEADVIAGARELLVRNECVLQVEVYDQHHAVPQVLADLGYRQLVAVGPDLYFSNSDARLGDRKVIEVLEAAFASLIAYNLKG